MANAKSTRAACQSEQSDTLNVAAEVARMKRMTSRQLAEKYVEVFGEQTRSKNKQWLVKRIIWRMQANAEGGLSDRAKQRALEIANDADLRTKAPAKRSKPKAQPTTRKKVAKIETKHDSRLPLPGTELTRTYKGYEYYVKVLPNGFDYAGEIYRSLSAVAIAITGTKMSGFKFFGINANGGAQ